MTDEWTPDVLVVGGGAAGVLAAVQAAAAGRQVLLVRRGDSATAYSSGAVDVAEHHAGVPVGIQRTSVDAGFPILDAARALAASHPFHPYARVKNAVDQLPRALELLADVARDVGLVGRADATNRAVVTSAGTVKRTALVQSSMAGADVRDAAQPERVAVVHWPEFLHGDGRHLARMLTHVLAQAGHVFIPLEVQGVWSAQDALRTPHDMARRLDDAESQRRVVDAVLFSVRQHGPFSRVLLPPVLGLTASAALAAELQKALGIPVGEVLSGHPSVPGERLQRALDGGLVRHGIRATEGRVVSVQRENHRVVGITVERQGTQQNVPCGALVLCTGKYVTRGIVRDGGFEEPVLGLPVFLDGRRVDAGFVGPFVGELPEMDQPFMRVGVLTNTTLQPVDEHGAVVLTNVWAAGSVLAGYSPAQQQGGLGVAAVTGMLAGGFSAGMKDI